MKAVNASKFDGFRAAFAAGHEETVDLLSRQEYCDSSLNTLYVAWGDDGSPAFVQWLVTAADQAVLHRMAPGMNAYLQPDQVLVEGAYTFPKHRGRGIMSEGTGQQLLIAKQSGVKTAFARVSTANVASLRACASVGFVPYKVLVGRRILGVKTLNHELLDGDWQATWNAATGPKPAAR